MQFKQHTFFHVKAKKERGHLFKAASFYYLLFGYNLVGSSQKLYTRTGLFISPA
jgi:hypothetical protein